MVEIDYEARATPRGCKMALTAKQRRLRAEIEEIASIVDMDHCNIENYSPDNRTVFLELTKNKLVRADVIMKYTLIDEFLTVLICHYFFRKIKKSETFKTLWKMKRFRIFNHYVTDEIFLMKKLSIVDAIGKIPKDIKAKIAAMNDLRNALTHSFFPENRRRYAADKEVRYNGMAIFTTQGIKTFDDDFNIVRGYLERRAFDT